MIMNESLIGQKLINIIERHKKNIPWFVLDELISVAKECRANDINSPSTVDPNIIQAERIIQLVCRASNITIPELKSSSRKGCIIDAKRIAVHHIYPDLLSCRRTSKILGTIKRATVVYHKKKYADLYSVNPEFREVADRANDLINKKEGATP